MLFSIRTNQRFFAFLRNQINFVARKLTFDYMFRYYCNTELNDLKKLVVWENMCLQLFKISTGRQDKNLRSMPCHCRNEISVRFGYHSNNDLQMYTIHLPPMKLPGCPSMTISVAMATQFIILHTGANFEKSNTQIFSNKYFFSNQLILCFACQHFV